MNGRIKVSHSQCVYIAINNAAEDAKNNNQASPFDFFFSVMILKIYANIKVDSLAEKIICNIQNKNLFFNFITFVIHIVYLKHILSV